MKHQLAFGSIGFSSHLATSIAHDTHDPAAMQHAHKDGIGTNAHDGLAAGSITDA
jgi:hypothetical protein